MIWIIATLSALLLLAAAINNALDECRWQRPHRRWFGLVSWLDRKYPQRFP